MSLADGTTVPNETAIRLEECEEIGYRDELGQGFEAWTYWHPTLGYTYLRVHDRHDGRWQTVPIPSDKCNEALAHALLWVDMPVHRVTASDMPAGSDVT